EVYILVFVGSGRGVEETGQYVTDECRQVEPINQVLDGGRQVACHRWQEINRDRSIIQIAPPSAAFLRRRALFEHAATHSSLPSRNS
ncbi:hypothetical protein ACPRR5_23790, partial [Enterobacter asburiae]